MSTIGKLGNGVAVQVNKLLDESLENPVTLESLLPSSSFRLLNSTNNIL